MDTIKEKLIENCELLFNNEDYKNQYGISPLMIFKNLKLIQEDKSKEKIVEKLHNELDKEYNYGTDLLAIASKLYSDCKTVINYTYD